MKYALLLSFMFLLVPMALLAQGVNFDDYFIDKTLRIDYYHTGDAETEIVTLHKAYRQGMWAGSRKHLLDPFNNGAYFYQVYDNASGEMIYSKGFDSYFKEYQTSGPATEGVVKTFQETAILPYPKSEVKVVLAKRDKYNKLNEVAHFIIDPDDIGIIREKKKDENVIVYQSVDSGDPHAKVDLAIIAEGYTKNEVEKFKADIDKFTKYFFEVEPYKSMKGDFNFYGVLLPSEETGVDEPRADIYQNTVLGATFNSMGSERYLLTEEIHKLHDIAANVPYDALYIMCNHKRYGGGGIYNFFCTFTTDNQFDKYLFVHEFGHSFGGLADEYYTSATAYDGFYPDGVEPVEPNITRLMDTENVKWEKHLTEGIEIPTPWEKADYDSFDYKWQKERAAMNNRTAELKRTNAPEADVKAAEDLYAKRDREHSDWVDEYLASSKYAGKVGAFEGAGYVSEGLYRPMLDCIMFSKGDKPFCAVCEAHLAKVIKHYTE